MKTIKSFAIILIILLSSQVFSQKSSDIETILAKYSSAPFARVFDQPIEVSPLIGLKLDKAEHKYFLLFPRIEGFQEAVFYLNPDSTINAKIKYKRDEEIRDTVIIKFKYLVELQNHILQILQINIDAGTTHTVILQLKDGREQRGIILSIDNNSIKTIDPASLKTVTSDNLNSIISVNSIENIQYVLVEETGPVFVYGAGGLLIGTLGGALIGRSIALSGDKTGDSSSGQLWLSEEARSSCIGTILGGGIGGALGLVVGLAIGSNSTVTDEYEINEIFDYSVLQEYTLIPNRISETPSNSK